MAAAAIAMAAIQPPVTWTTCTVDACLICGQSYFAKQNALRPTSNQSLPMNSDEIVGIVDGVFGSQSVRIEQSVDAIIYGMLNKFNPKDRDILRLDKAIKQFIDGLHDSAIVTCSGKTFKTYFCLR